MTISDISFLINYLFINFEPAPTPDVLLGDANCNGTVTIADVSVLIDHLFISQDPLQYPCFAFND